MPTITYEFNMSYQQYSEVFCSNDPIQEVKDSYLQVTGKSINHLKLAWKATYTYEDYCTVAFTVVE